MGGPPWKSLRPLKGSTGLAGQLRSGGGRSSARAWGRHAGPGMGNSGKMEKARKAAVYLRVSTDDQTHANQAAACIQACQARGWTWEVFEEVESGAADSRLVWDGVLELARRGKVDAVVFYSISRVGRRRSQIAGDLANLARWGAALVSIRESFLDVDGSPELARMRELLIQWFGWFAEAERDELIDRTNQALERIRAGLAKNGSHVSKSGRRITSLGRPGFDRRWRDRARAIAAEGITSALQIARALRLEGAPEINPRTVAGWVWPRGSARFSP